MHAAPITAARPMRRFSWRTGQLHRPSLAYSTDTDRLHGAESHKEALTLLALEFAGDVTHVLGQPFALRYSTGGKARSHIPDVLATTATDVWLIDVRPAGQIEHEDRIAFAAAAEAALAVGWRYLVVAGWHRQVISTLGDISAQRRTIVDHFGLEPVLLATAEAGPVTFGELVEATDLPAVARAHAISLLWRRRLGVDLAAPLTDASFVWSGARR